MLSINRIIPPSNWEHDPTLENDYGETVAMNLASRRIIPP